MFYGNWLGKKVQMICRERTVSNILRGWKIRRTPDSSDVERCLRRGGFEQVDAYCFNSAAIRVRVVSSKFCDLDGSHRFQLFNTGLRSLPDDLLSSITHVTLLTPIELEAASQVVDANTLADGVAKLRKVSQNVSVPLIQQMLVRNYEFEHLTFDVPRLPALRRFDSP